MNTLKLKFIMPHLDYLNDVQDIVRSFFPHIEIFADADDFLKVEYSYSESTFSATVFSSFADTVHRTLRIEKSDFMLYKKLTKRFVKTLIYDYLSGYLQVNLPYGSLTGVRPTKLYYELLESHTDPKGILIDEFRVSKSKAELIEKVVQGQRGHYELSLENASLFLNIPFCPTRCAYCSFISSEVKKVEKLLPAYTDAAVREIEAIKEHLLKDKTLRSIYVGGGTPTSIGVEFLREILAPLASENVEFTVEAGRPDTINDEILSMLKEMNVSRLSVNPQTFNPATLERIGREHSVDEVYESFYKAKAMGFDVNMDLIALLPGETFEDFALSLKKAANLRPENITVHTLSIKRGAKLAAIESERGLAQKMTDFAYAELEKEGYRPYYMYRQKNMADNLENIGFSLPGKECRYNIDMMEEISAVYGAGAGAMTKFFYPQGAIERMSNPKGIKEYLDRIDLIIDKKTSSTYTKERV